MIDGLPNAKPRQIGCLPLQNAYPMSGVTHSSAEPKTQINKGKGTNQSFLPFH
jgi:hypothetical protein